MNNDILRLYKSIGSNQESPLSKNDPLSCIFSDDTTDLKDHPSNKKDEEDKLHSSNFLPILQHDSQKTESRNQNLRNNLSNENLAENYLKRKREKCSKGLRHFSMKVCEKVKHKSVTSYNEVADELVHEYCNYSGEHSLIDFWSYDQKNVRRRVYDALNVLMAMNIISKEKKEIKWIGLPCNKRLECQELEESVKRMKELINLKTNQLKHFVAEHIACKILIAKNKNPAKKDSQTIIKSPFIIIESDKKTTIDCNIASDKKEYILHFDNTFKIITQRDLFSKMNLSLENCNERAIPKLFNLYLESSKATTPTSNNLNLQSYKTLVKFDKFEKGKSPYEYHNGSIDDAGEYSGDSEEFLSDEISFIDSSN